MNSALLITATASLALLCTSATAQDWEKYMESGRRARTAQNLVEAERQFKAAAQDARKRNGKGLPLAESLDSLAGIYHETKQYSRSEALYKQSLSIKERLLGQWDLHLAETLDSFASLLDAEGKHDRAEPLYKRAHAIREQALSAHPDVYIDGVRQPVPHPR